MSDGGCGAFSGTSPAGLVFVRRNDTTGIEGEAALPDSLLCDAAADPKDARRRSAAEALRRAAALVERDVERSGARASLTGGEYHAAALLLTAEAFAALMEAAALYDRSGAG